MKARLKSIENRELDRLEVVSD